MTVHRHALEALLARDADSLRRSERQAFDRFSRGRNIVLMGAGRLGQRTLQGLREHGIEPLAFADNNPMRPEVVDGLMVLDPASAAREFGRHAVFVVTIWGANSPHRFAHSRDQLTTLGCDLVCPFPLLYWKYAETLLPFYLQDLPSKVLDERDAILDAFELWSDDASRHEYVAQVRLRLDGDFDGLPAPVRYPQYFPPDLYTWSATERIVDGGAFDGDSIRALLSVRGDAFGHLLAIEPDPSNFQRLQQTVAALPASVRARIDVRRVALDARERTLHLEATGTAASATQSAEIAGAVTVAAAPIDRLVEGPAPTFIKLDIEGFEPEALEGARETIERHGPVVAVCVYHQQAHLWRIPLTLARWRDDFAFFLRPHNEEGWDLVCYAVPRARLIGGAR